MNENNQPVVAAFGKHPGWDDHIDDLGLDTEPLVKLKRSLYINGVGGNIDTGVWEKLREDQRLGGFQHVFLRCEQGLALIGRMWASQDGKGRSRYPMIVTVQCGTGRLPWLLANVLPALAEAESRCRNATTAEEVRRIIGRVQLDLHASLCHSDPVQVTLPDWLKTGKALAEAVTGAADGAPDAFYRVFYRVTQMLGGAPVPDGRRGQLARPDHLRVKADADVGQALALWLAVMRELTGTDVALMLVCPMDRGWIDIILGEPGTQQFYCLLASLQAIPLTTGIPYNIERPIMEQADRWLERWRSGALDLRTLLTMDGQGDPWQQKGAGFKQWLHRAKSLVGPA